MDRAELMLTADPDQLAAHARAAVQRRAIAPAPAELERLARWLVRAQATCALWCDSPDVGTDAFEQALRDAAHG